MARGDTRSDLTGGSGVLIDMWNETILDKIERGVGYIYTLSHR